MAKEECKNCRYYLKQESNMVGQETGTCRRCPPTANTIRLHTQFGDQIQIQGFQAPVQPQMWCGEWRPFLHEVN